jgi:hypothetical protein
MPFTLKHTRFKDYLEVTIHSTIIPGKEIDEATQRWNKVAELCEEENCFKVLAILHFEGVYNINKAFKLVGGAKDFGWKLHYKLAVIPVDEDWFYRLSFTETTMNRLGYEMKLFRSKRHGKKWLLQS